MGIKVPVIGIAFSTTWDPTDLKDNEVTLNEMAKAGGMPRPMDPAYYAANSSAELAAAFAQITGVVISCTFDLKGMKPPSPDDVAVKIDGVKVPRDKTHGEGWDYDARHGERRHLRSGVRPAQGRRGDQQRADHLRLPRHHHRLAALWRCDHSSTRRRLSSGDRSSTRVMIAQRTPWGSISDA